ncbi:MAG: hypothetical protein KA140_02620 [Caldisericia bacterium]|nr:hypothetical protein [Caldisericia bacterium]
MEIATWILNFLTLSGLAIAIIFYYKQNSILQNKSRIENFFELYNILDKRNFGNDVNFFSEVRYFLEYVSSNPNASWKNEGPMCHTANVICSLYYSKSIDENLFDLVLKGLIFHISEWIFLRKKCPSETSVKFYPKLHKFWLEHKNILGKPL